MSLSDSKSCSENIMASSNSQCPVANSSTQSIGSTSGCPVLHSNSSASKPDNLDSKVASSGCPVMHSKAKPTIERASSGCPVMHSKAKPTEKDVGRREASSPKSFNVYSEPIDPTNQMPYNPNQMPHPDQKEALSVERVVSSIPKGGTNETWSFPSPQMFYNALKRKGKDDNVAERDVETIVAIHNNMNERTWNMLLKWEAKYAKYACFIKLICFNAYTLRICPNPKLLRFLGRPDELSPKARFKTWLGYVFLFFPTIC